jgi:hypothetical protein
MQSDGKKYNWYGGWYGTRLHAHPAGLAVGNWPGCDSKSICGETIYEKPPNKYAAKALEKAPKCKRCLKAIQARKESPDAE